MLEKAIYLEWCVQCCSRKEGYMGFHFYKAREFRVYQKVKGLI